MANKMTDKQKALMTLLANSSEDWVNWRQRPAQTEEHEHR